MSDFRKGSKMKRTLGFAVIVSMTIALFGFVSTASAAGGSTLVIPVTTESWLSQYFDFGDVRGGYSTGVYGTIQMNANLSVSSGVITSCNTSVYKENWLDVPGKTYFQIAVSFNGNYDSLPTNTNGLSQSNQASHRGVTINEYAGLGSYQEWQQGDQAVPTGAFWSNANGSVTLSPFTITNVNGYFNDNSWVAPWDNVTHNDFSYSVNWTGYTDDAVAAGMFSAIAPTTVPEPATMTLLAIGAIGLVVRRRKQI